MRQPAVAAPLNAHNHRVLGGFDKSATQDTVATSERPVSIRLMHVEPLLLRKTPSWM